jgi:hypothetical protein
MAYSIKIIFVLSFLSLILACNQNQNTSQSTKISSTDSIKLADSLRIADGLKQLEKENEEFMSEYFPHIEIKYSNLIQVSHVSIKQPLNGCVLLS